MVRMLRLKCDWIYKNSKNKIFMMNVKYLDFLKYLLICL